MTNTPGEIIDGGAVSLVGAADNSYKSTVPLGATFVTVTANTNDTNDWITLPLGVKTGHVVKGYSAVAHEIRTAASSNIKINDVDSDGSQEAAITATWNWEATYMGSTGWVLKAWTKLAAPTTAIIPD